MYKYGSPARRFFRYRWKLTGLVQDHHVIPQQFKTNGLIYKKIHDSKNIIMMPTPKGIQELSLRENRIIHWGPHPKYNAFVFSELKLCENDKQLEDS